MVVGDAVEVMTGFGWEIGHVKAICADSGIKVSFFFADRRGWFKPSIVRPFAGVVGYGD